MSLPLWAQSLHTEPRPSSDSDFGSSLDSRLVASSTTEGPARTTRMYMAPEVLAAETRNSSSDIYSLGCVFIELFFALFLRREVNVDNFSTAMFGLHDELNILDLDDAEGRCIRACILSMTKEDPSRRLPMSSVVKMICTKNGFCCHICQICQVPQQPWQESPELPVARGGLKVSGQIVSGQMAFGQMASGQMASGQNVFVHVTGDVIRAERDEGPTVGIKQRAIDSHTKTTHPSRLLAGSA